MSEVIKRINPDTLPDSSSIGYSQISVVDSGKMAYISGQVALVKGKSEIPKSLVEQMKIVSQNAQHALLALGASPRDIAIARIYVVDLTNDRLNELMPHFLATFNGEKPSLTGIGVAALANPDFQVELELVVRLPDSFHQQYA